MVSVSSESSRPKRCHGVQAGQLLFPKTYGVWKIRKRAPHDEHDCQTGLGIVALNQSECNCGAHSCGGCRRREPGQCGSIAKPSSPLLSTRRFTLIAILDTGVSIAQSFSRMRRWACRSQRLTDYFSRRQWIVLSRRKGWPFAACGGGRASAE